MRSSIGEPVGDDRVDRQPEFGRQVHAGDHEPEIDVVVVRETPQQRQVDAVVGARPGDDRDRPHDSISRPIRLSAGMSTRAVLPTIWSRRPGWSPVPGRLVVSIASRDHGAGGDGTRRRRGSCARPPRCPPRRAVGCLRPSPRELSTERTSRTSSASSSGSSDAAWSGPAIPRSSVKCFSRTQAPRATAASAVVMPGVWSE